MLRITVERGSESTTLKLEGKIIAPWTEELERMWRGMSLSPAESLVVDLGATPKLEPNSSDDWSKLPICQSVTSLA